MEKVRLAVYDTNMQPLIDVLHRSYEPDYTRQISEHYLFIVERYNLLLRYQLTINVVIERAEDMLIIDIVGIGGAQSFLGLWGDPAHTRTLSAWQIPLFLTAMRVTSEGSK